MDRSEKEVGGTGICQCGFGLNVSSTAQSRTTAQHEWLCCCEPVVDGLAARELRYLYCPRPSFISEFPSRLVSLCGSVTLWRNSFRPSRLAARGRTARPFHDPELRRRTGIPPHWA